MFGVRIKENAVETQEKNSSMFDLRGARRYIPAMSTRVIQVCVAVYSKAKSY